MNKRKVETNEGDKNLKNKVGYLKETVRERDEKRETVRG